MQIIPVIDLMRGQVVHAKRGQRGQYTPLKSTLCNGSQPLTILDALLKLYPFEIVYIADIDAILGTGNHNEIIEILIKYHPNITFWLDAGIDQMNARALHQEHNIRPVIGSENIKTLLSYREISYACNSQHVLSLDFSTALAMGIDDLHTQAKFWPDDVICMTLNAVGNEQGTDLKRLNQLMALNKTAKKMSNLYAAGGVRQMADLLQLEEMNISGALVATALHLGHISSNELKQLLTT